MYELWLAKYPDTMVDEQRLANQRRVIINHNLLTPVELEELQRNIVEQLAQPVEATNQNDETTPVAAQQQPNIIEVPMEQNHELNPKTAVIKGQAAEAISRNQSDQITNTERCSEKGAGTSSS